MKSGRQKLDVGREIYGTLGTQRVAPNYRLQKLAATVGEKHGQFQIPGGKRRKSRRKQGSHWVGIRVDGKASVNRVDMSSLVDTPWN